MIKYEAIVAYLKNEISVGKINPGERLPSLRKICTEFACSKVTAVKAFDLLEKQHFIYSVPRSGHYLIGNPPALASRFEDSLIDFSTLAPDEHLLPDEDLRHCLSKALEYYKKDLFSNQYLRGLPNLIKAIRKQLQNYQVFTDNRNIMVTSGAQQAINILAIMPFPNRRNTVLVEQPTYYGAVQSLAINQVKAVGIERTGAGINLNELEKLFRDGDIKFFYTMPRFHNPGGFSYPTGVKKQILHLAQKYDVYLVEDDYLADLEVDSKADPLFAFDGSGRVIYLKSYSKVLLPGLRIAAVVLPSSLTATFESYKRWSDLNTSMLSQGALELYIQSGLYDVHVKTLKKTYSQRMRYLQQITAHHDSGVHWNVPASGLLASMAIDPPIWSADLIKRLKNQNVLLAESAACFLTNDWSNPQFLRLSVSRTNEEQITKGIAAIANELRANGPAYKLRSSNGF